MFRKGLVILTILLFVGTCIIPAIAQQVKEKTNSEIENLSINNFALKNNKENIIRPMDVLSYSSQDMNTPLFDISVLMNKSNTQTAWGLTSADFNNDGKMDFAVAYADCPLSHSTISIFYNNGNGNFTKDDVYTFYYDYIKSLNSGDYDNDGDVDLIYSYSEYDQNFYYIYGLLHILFNDGENHFGNDTLIAKRGTGIPGDPDGRINPYITSADYDMDGDIDLVVGDNSGNVEFYLNNGEANFTSAGIIHDYGLNGERGLTWGVTSADYDGDGDIDFLVAARVRDYYGHVWFKQNMMTESNHSIVFELDSGVIIADITTDVRGTASLTSLDYNDDGNMDFIAGIFPEAYLYMNKESSFKGFYICRLPASEEGYPDDLTAGGLASADYDNDGYTDLIMGGVQGVVRLFINKHILAVITRPRDAYWYKFDQEQYQLFKVTGVLCIGKITIGVTELENMEKVEFYINGILRSTDTTPPYNFTWNVGNPLKHRHTIKIIAYGNDGKVSEDKLQVWRFL